MGTRIETALRRALPCVMFWTSGFYAFQALTVDGIKAATCIGVSLLLVLAGVSSAVVAARRRTPGVKVDVSGDAVHTYFFRAIEGTVEDRVQPNDSRGFAHRVTFDSPDDESPTATAGTPMEV